jgi:hypothetical protein
MKLQLALIAAALLPLEAPSQMKPVDPLASFKKVVAACEAQANEWPPDTVRQLKNGEWSRNFLEITSVTHDVRRTDSLVSPFTAYIRLETLEHIARRKTEDDARVADKQEATAIRGTDEIRYAFQDSKWKLMNGTTRREMKFAEQTSFNDPLGAVELSADSFTGNARWTRCVP